MIYLDLMLLNRLTVDTLKLDRKKKLIWFSAGLIGSVICQILFSYHASEMSSRGFDILDLEFAWTSATLDPILSAWSPIIDHVVYFMIIDMIFPITYFLLFSGWSILLSSDSNMVSIAVLMALLASLFDYIENLFTFNVILLPDAYLSIAPFMISFFASIKFIFLLVVIIINIIVMIQKL